ncbi:MAG: hypothetical protein Q7R52_02865 [archaeon]|nr:hypothetical protein [archaeon]
MSKEILLKIVGSYLIMDGIISFIHFKKEATTLEQTARIVRTGIGGLLFFI